MPALRQMVASGAATVVLGYVGIALVAVTALPVHDGHTELATRYLNDPMVGIVTQMHPHWLAQASQIHRRGSGDADAGGGRELGDARAVAAGILAVDQSPDPQRPRPAASRNARPRTC